MKLKIGLACLILLLLIGCATPATKNGAQTTAQSVYLDAREALEQHDFVAAISHFKSIEVYFPAAAKYIEQAHLELAYSYFRIGEHLQAIALADIYVRDYPASEKLDYAYYLKGIARYEMVRSLLAEQMSAAPGMDIQAQAYFASRDFKQLTEKFPNSEYAMEAASRLASLREALAQKIIDAARIQYDEGRYANAVLLARHVTEHYPDSLDLEAAMKVMTRAYEQMQLTGVESFGLEPAGVESSESESESESVAAMISAVDQPEVAIQTAVDDALVVAEQVASSPMVNDEGWLMTRSSKQFSVQLMSSLYKPLLERFVRKQGLDGQVVIYQNRLREGQWYVLLFGLYADMDLAFRAIDGLPQALRRYDPWVRNLVVVHKQIKGEDSAP